MEDKRYVKEKIKDMERKVAALQKIT